MVTKYTFCDTVVFDYIPFPSPYICFDKQLIYVEVKQKSVLLNKEYVILTSEPRLIVVHFSLLFSL